MKVLCWLLAFLLVAPSESNPLIRLHQADASLVLEREILSLGDIPLPTLLRLKKMVDKGNMDLEEMVGGGATKHTQYEKDIHKMLFVALAKPDMSAEATMADIDALLKATNSFECKNCLDGEQIQPLLNAIGKIPPLLAIGEAIDQFINLSQGCPLSDRDGKFNYKVKASVLAENAAKSFGMGQSKVAELQKKFAALVTTKEVTEKEDPDDPLVSACNFIQPYLIERGFMDQQSAEESADLVRPLATGADEYFEVDKKISFPMFAIFDFSRYLMQEVPVMNLQQLTKYYSPESDDVVSLDVCETQISNEILKNAERFASVWKSEDLLFAAKGSSQLPISAYPTFARKHEEDEADKSIRITFKGFERLLKTIDIGSFIHKGSDFDTGKLKSFSETGSTTDSMESILFNAISKNDDRGLISEVHIADFLRKLCGQQVDAGGRAEEALYDYDHDGNGELDRKEFASALKNYPVLVHGISDTEMEDFFKKVQGEDQTMLNAKQWIAAAQTLTMFGANAKYKKAVAEAERLSPAKSFVIKSDLAFLTSEEQASLLSEGILPQGDEIGVQQFYDALVSHFQDWGKHYGLLAKAIPMKVTSGPGGGDELRREDELRGEGDELRREGDELRREDGLEGGGEDD